MGFIRSQNNTILSYACSFIGSPSFLRCLNISNLFYIILILTLFWYFTPKSIVNNIPSISFLPVNKLALEHFLIDSAADIIVDSNIIDVVIYISSFIALMLTIRYYLF
mgnify:CR=1 FL=1